MLMQPRICIWVSVCVCIYICISVPFVCEVDLENKYSILFYSILSTASQPSYGYNSSKVRTGITAPKYDDRQVTAYTTL